MCYSAQRRQSWRRLEFNLAEGAFQYKSPPGSAISDGPAAPLPFASRLNGSGIAEGELRHGVFEGFEAEFVDGLVEDVFDFLGALVAGALVFAGGANDDSVAADFGDDDIGAGSIGCPWLMASMTWPSTSTAPLGSILERATPTRPMSPRRVGGEGVVIGEGLAEEGFAHGGARPVFEGGGDQDGDGDHGDAGKDQAGEGASRRAFAEGDDERSDEGDAGEDANEAASGDEDFEHDERAADDHQENGPS